jgi:hypothetical protein
MIIRFPPGMTADRSSDFTVQGLMSNMNAYAEEWTTVATSGTNVTLTVAQFVAKNIILTVGASNNFTVTLPPTSKIIDALGPTLPPEGNFYFPLYISNIGTGFVGTLTAGDSSTTIDVASVGVPDSGVNKWMVQLSTPTTLAISFVGSFAATGGGVGTVTSVGLSMPAEFAVANSPVTGNDTLAVTKATQSANLVWAGPTSGAASAPTFRALTAADVPGTAGGGMVLLESHDALNSAALDLTATFTSTYDQYFISVINFVPVTNGVNWHILFSTDGGATWLSSNYRYVIVYNSSGGASNLTISNSDTKIDASFTVKNNGAFPLSADIWFYDPLSTSFGKLFYMNGRCMSNSDGNLYERHGTGGNTTLTAVNAMRFQFATGNISSGTIRSYAIAKV